MEIYNTLTKKVEEFIPNEDQVVKMYTCGPTVYNYAHIGNLRTYIFNDILEKSLNYLGYNVKRAMNITDVGHLQSDADTGEDKMELGAKREGKTVYEIANFYTKAFFDDCDKLNIKRPEIVEKASEQIDEYIKIIEKLLKEGYAYISDGNVYFDISKAPNYYELSGKNEEELRVGVRDDVNEDSNKRNPFDFVLWFTNSKYENHAMIWDSPWGRGYPGWHLECSAISMKYLGDHLDIHTGGIDLIFPHHTNEIAQSEAYLGHKWCNYWIHGEYLNAKNGKMSKSKGEFLTLSLLESKGYDPLSYRFMCLQSHYRNQLVFSYESLDTAQSAYIKLKNKIKSIKKDNSKIDDSRIKYYDSRFKNALSDDLNTSNTLTILFGLLKDENTNNNTKLKLIEEFDKVLSLDLLKNDEIIDEYKLSKINDLIEKRNNAKINKDYELADKIREELLSMNIEIKDTKEGTTFEMR
ncbi:MAG TPA: cysteine--tRNA ligase [Bacilli bacterium]|nr:cysteine--tRNA ligase [Bacilli bacterium]